MSSDYDQDLVDTAIIHLKGGEPDMARKYLERALDVADDPETRARASWYLSQLTDDVAQKRSLLEDVLSYNRNDAEARRALAILDGKLKVEDVIDPDKLAPAPQGEIAPAQSDRFSCPNCGARMVFAPDGQSLVCENCGYHEGQNRAVPAQPEEQDFVLAMATAAGHRSPVTMHAFTCQGCGANLLLAPETISVTCSYCGTPHVVDVASTRELIQPDAIIPFALDREQAEQRLLDWGKQHKLPAGSRATSPRGIYLPVWSFDFNGEIPYQAQIEVREGNRTVVRVINDTYPVIYNDVAVPATRKMESLLNAALPDFQIGQAVAYDPRYLADWPAEVYEISMADASLDARARSVQRMKSQISDYLHLIYDGLAHVTPSPAILAAESFKLVLVPAWITSYRAGSLLRQALVNGQTGSVHSDEPPRAGVGWLGKWFGS